MLLPPITVYYLFVYSDTTLPSVHVFINTSEMYRNVIESPLVSVNVRVALCTSGYWGVLVEGDSQCVVNVFHSRGSLGK